MENFHEQILALNKNFEEEILKLTAKKNDELTEFEKAYIINEYQMELVRQKSISAWVEENNEWAKENIKGKELAESEESDYDEYVKKSWFRKIIGFKFIHNSQTFALLPNIRLRHKECFGFHQIEFELFNRELWIELRFIGFEPYN